MIDVRSREAVPCAKLFFLLAPRVRWLACRVLSAPRAQPVHGRFRRGDEIRGVGAGVPNVSARAAHIGRAVVHHVIGRVTDAIRPGVINRVIAIAVRDGVGRFTLGIQNVKLRDAVRVNLIGQLAFVVPIGNGEGRTRRGGVGRLPSTWLNAPCEE